MSENATAIAVAAWVEEVLPELTVVRHFLTATKTTLPDAMVDVSRKNVAIGGGQFFPWEQLQQVYLRVYSCELSLMVEQAGALESDKDEQEQLRDFGDRLEASLLSDATLGGRVEMASPFAGFDYSLPFIEYPDGVRGRQLIVSLSIGERVSELGD